MRYLPVALLLFALPSWGADMTLFSVSPSDTGGEDYSIKLQILFFMTLLGLLPTLLLMMTSFTRIIIVLAILRQAMGLQQSPQQGADRHQSDPDPGDHETGLDRDVSARLRAL